MKNCVLITSVIEPDTAPLDYSPTRSVYTPQERYDQTLLTIESVKKHIPDTDVVIVECSPPGGMLESLASSVTALINLYPNDTVRKSLYKGLSEAVMLEAGLSFLVGKPYKNIFKITGRYQLNEQFNYSLWDNDHIIALTTDIYGRLEGSVHTFLYKIPGRKLEKLIKHYSDMVLTQNIVPTEAVLYGWLAKQGFIKITENIGITVLWSSYNHVYHP